MTPVEPQPNTEPKGFGHSKKRVAAEMLGALAVIVLLIWGAFALVGGAMGVLVSFAPLTLDQAIGESVWEQIAPPSDRCTDPAPLAYVEAIAAPLIEAYDGPHQFRFAVIDAPEINAFALPGGYITVHMGLLEAAETGEEIAAVLAHEMHHVTERHGLRRIARQLGAFAALGIVFGAVDLGALTGVAVQLMGNAYDRDQETEADTLGHALLVDARIDPIGMVRFFERLADEGPSVPALLSTHPGSEDRARLAESQGGLDGEPRDLPPPPEMNCR